MKKVTLAILITLFATYSCSDKNTSTIYGDWAFVESSEILASENNADEYIKALYEEVVKGKAQPFSTPKSTIVSEYKYVFKKDEHSYFDYKFSRTYFNDQTHLNLQNYTYTLRYPIEWSVDTINSEEKITIKYYYPDVINIHGDDTDKIIQQAKSSDYYSSALDTYSFKIINNIELHFFTPKDTLTYKRCN